MRYFKSFFVLRKLLLSLFTICFFQIIQVQVTFAACTPRAEICDAVDNDCDGRIDEVFPELDRECQSGLFGICALGKTKCIQGSLICLRNQNPTVEACDGLDNDCDGNVDDQNPQGNQGCNTGLLGACAEGYTQCQNGTLRCIGNALPGLEVCDGRDNNCNGETDEGNPGGNQGCLTDNTGVCSEGKTRCTNGQLLCVRNNDPASELCDALDNDCDGKTDESIRLQPEQCIVENQLGECQYGINVCARGLISCLAYQPRAEICDGKDNDCDGNTDENVTNAGPNTATVGSACQSACGTGQIVCALGQLKCNAPTAENGVSEYCDSIDNDCDGNVDEGQNLNLPCTTGEAGICTNGQLNCVAGQLQCVGNYQRADQQNIEETCDGIDEDCDGTVDENSARSGLSCLTDQQGVCSVGVTFCENGQMICLARERASLEQCDGKDNDCDGNTDETLITQDQTCDTQAQGECKIGVQSCQNGQNLCQPLYQIQEEICDGKDNDCDGNIDESFVGANEACDTLRVGICATGTTQCLGGAITCVQQNQEVENYDPCDGLDNDCDGRFDEAESRINGRCESSLLGLCVLGRYRCETGTLICQSEQQPQNEACDGLDNDCDGNLDEGNPDGGSGCEIVGERGVCGIGQTFCEMGVLACRGTTEPSRELCDGLDNDCNGEIDDAVMEIGNVCEVGFLGQCNLGVYECNLGQLRCLPSFSPLAETCDALDNDCDGNTDEMLRLSTDACFSAFPGLCQIGSYACVAGQIDCLPIAERNPETCDLQDEDCDGKIDEGLRNRCGYCGQLPNEARCDGRDEDCDGRVDEGELCSGDQICVRGSCVDPCESSECGNINETCIEGGCVNRCEIANCEYGWTCENGVCSDPCADIRCPMGQVCARGECFNNSCYEVGCLPGQVCLENQCIIDPCKALTCEADEFCRITGDQGECVKSCAGISCLGNEKCVDGLCYVDRCAQVNCAEGQICQDGNCIRNDCVGILCGVGRTCIAGSCVDDPCLHVQCPAGEKCVLEQNKPQGEGDWLSQPNLDAQVMPDLQVSDMGLLDQSTSVDIQVLNDQNVGTVDMQRIAFDQQIPSPMTPVKSKSKEGCSQGRSSSVEWTLLLIGMWLFLGMALKRR